jgi:hypothetical protein
MALRDARTSSYPLDGTLGPPLREASPSHLIANFPLRKQNAKLKSEAFYFSPVGQKENRQNFGGLAFETEERL